MAHLKILEVRRLLNEGSLYREAFGDDALRFASHDESYIVEGFG
jgi:hypothetical protein